MAGPQLVVNGDDFGISEEVNEAIVRAFREGILTSCSLMATGEAFDHAVRLARENPGLGVGLHLVTVLDRPVLPPSALPTIVDGEGRLSSNPPWAGVLYTFSRRARSELGDELEAQWRRFEATGLPCSHVDSHLHMHVTPAIFRIALELAERHGIRRMRLPRDPFAPTVRFTRDRLWWTVLMALIFWPLCASMERKLDARGIAHTRRVFGNLRTDRMSEAYLLAILEGLTEGTWEVYSHPALPAAADEARLSPGRRQQLRELRMLVSPDVIRRIRELGIELVNYHGVEAVP
ncbi:MAG: hopanoid biosynthesis-associated protein HpnK [Gemmatimonadetes bacterium]|nr:hopanoid biosynthesis-associated protein HpnK [Gemmatimonadota bacterium]